MRARGPRQWWSLHLQALYANDTITTPPLLTILQYLHGGPLLCLPLQSRVMHESERLHKLHCFFHTMLYGNRFAGEHQITACIWGGGSKCPNPRKTYTNLYQVTCIDFPNVEDVVDQRQE